MPGKTKGGGIRSKKPKAKTTQSRRLARLVRESIERGQLTGVPNAYFKEPTKKELSIFSDNYPLEGVPKEYFPSPVVEWKYPAHERHHDVGSKGKSKKRRENKGTKKKGTKKKGKKRGKRT